MRAMMLVAAGTLLVGCAATPKPDLNEDGYKQWTRALAQVKHCGTTGKITPATAAAGVNLIGQSLAPYQFDPRRIETGAARIMAGSPPLSPEFCNEVAINIEAALQKQRAATQASAPSQTSAPRYTNCSTYFGHTHCWSY